MTNILIQNPAKALVDIPREEVAAYMKKYNVSPVEAFSDLLSDRMFREIDKGTYGPVLKVLVENVIGKGLKNG